MLCVHMIILRTSINVSIIITVLRFYIIIIITRILWIKDLLLYTVLYRHNIWLVLVFLVVVYRVFKHLVVCSFKWQDMETTIL